MKLLEQINKLLKQGLNVEEASVRIGKGKEWGRRELSKQCYRHDRKTNQYIPKTDTPNTTQKNGATSKAKKQVTEQGMGDYAKEYTELTEAEKWGVAIDRCVQFLDEYYITVRYRFVEAIAGHDAYTVENNTDKKGYNGLTRKTKCLLHWSEELPQELIQLKSASNKCYLIFYQDSIYLRHVHTLIHVLHTYKL